MAFKPFKVALISGSQRPVQAGQQITDFVQAVIEKHLGSQNGIELTQINIRDLDLPLYNEPGVPQTIKSPDDYTNETTKAWSRTITALDAFVIVTPEYNYNIPAGLKNAIDLLWHEWAGKPVAIVSYGVVGGNYAYDGIKRAFDAGVKARTVETPVQLSFGPLDNGIMFKAGAGGDLGLSADKEDSLWADKKGDIVKAWGELVALLNEPAKA